MEEQESSTSLGFTYRPPQELSARRPKSVVRLCQSKILKGSVQVIREGGENNLHSHTGQDGFWFVLRGRATFYGSDDSVLAALGPEEGILIERNTPYWFESSGDEILELLHVSARHLDGNDRRINVRETPGQSR